MEQRSYQNVINEIQHHWATEGMNIHTGDDGFSEAVYGAMQLIASEELGIEKNKFYGKVYRLVKKNWED